jgi:hypothetical protein
MPIITGGRPMPGETDRSRRPYPAGSAACGPVTVGQVYVWEVLIARLLVDRSSDAGTVAVGLAAGNCRVRDHGASLRRRCGQRHHSAGPEGAVPAGSSRAAPSRRRR